MKKIILFFAAVFCFTIVNAQHFAWAKKGGNPTSTYNNGSGVAVDASGNSYITGHFQGNATFGTFTLSAPTTTDMFLVKYNGAGVAQWAQQGVNADAMDVETDGAGNIIVTGNYWGTATFGATNLTSAAGVENMFIIKYTPAGTVVWAKGYGGTVSGAGLQLNNLSVDQYGNSFVTGNYAGTTYFGTDSLMGGGPFVAKFNSTGDPVWQNKLRLSGNQAFPNAVTNDSSGNVYMSGMYDADTVFAGTNYILNSYPGVYNWNSYIVKYNSSGVFQWIKGIGGYTGTGRGIWDSDVDKNGNIYFTGNLSGDIDFGGGMDLTDAGGGDMFIAKYNATGICLWAKQSTGSGYEAGMGIDVNRNGNIYVTGGFADVGIWDSTYTANADINSNDDAFVVDYDTNGSVHWLKTATGIDNADGFRNCSDSLNNCYFIGSFVGNTAFGSTTLTAGSAYQIFVSKLDALTAGIIPSPICAGSHVNVPYTSTATFTGANVFTAELSDSAGTFLTPVNIGTLTSTSPNGIISSTIPPTTFQSSNYHIRVTSTSPAITGSWANTFEVRAAPATPQICLVTVDVPSTANVIDWEKDTLATDIDSFRIYREVTTGVYSNIASVSFDSLSEYIDYGANPNVTSYRYQIGILDNCGQLTDSSLWHSTIHLQVLGGGNLQWTLYAIEASANPVTFYRVLRDDGAGFNPISSTIPGGNTTYTDLAYASFPTSDYRVDVTWSISCNPTRTLINTTRSNIKHQNLSTGISPESLNEETSVYPNPSSNEVNVEVSEMIREADVSIYNSLGQKIFGEKINGDGVSKTTKHIAIENYAKGIYTISIESNGTKVFKKLVVN